MFINIFKRGAEYTSYCSSTEKDFTQPDAALAWLIFLHDERKNEHYADQENAPGLEWGKEFLKKKQHLLMMFEDCSF